MWQQRARLANSNAEHSRAVCAGTSPRHRITDHAHLRRELRIAFGAIQQLPQTSAGERSRGDCRHGQGCQDKAVADVAAKGEPAPDAKARQIGANASDSAVAKVNKIKQPGTVGRFCSRSSPFISSVAARCCVFQIPALIFVPLFFWGYPPTRQRRIAQHDQDRHLYRRTIHRGAIQLLGNYIPLAFPLHLRGTGESFAANIGGRIGTAAAWLTLTSPPRPHPAQPRSPWSARAWRGVCFDRAPFSPNGYPNRKPEELKE